MRAYLRSSRMDFLQHFLLGQPVEDNGQDSGGVMLSTARDFGGGALTAGFDAELARSSLLQHQVGPTTDGPPEANVIRPAGRQYDYTVDSGVVAAYASWRRPLTPRWSLEAGLRLEHARYDYDNRMIDGNTDENGSLRFTELPGGNYVISEIAPADYPVAVYVVHCTRDGNAFPTEYDDSTGLRITFTLPAGANIICDWYNIPRGAEPTPPPSGGSITVIVRLCTEDLDKIDNLRDECEMYGAGAEFQLKSVNSGATTSGKTGNDSRLVFTGLANGAYSLKETSGDWCKAEADHVDASGNVLVQNGGNTNVYIVNCGSRNIHTLPSTGAGPAGTSFPVTTWGLALLAVAILATGMTLKPAVARRGR